MATALQTLCRPCSNY